MDNRKYNKGQAKGLRIKILMGCGSSHVADGADHVMDDEVTYDKFEHFNVVSSYGVKGGPSPKELCEEAINSIREKGHETAPQEVKDLLVKLAGADWSLISSGAYPFADVYVCARNNITVVSVVSLVDAPISCLPKYSSDAMVATAAGIVEAGDKNIGCVAPSKGLSCMMISGPKPKSLIIDLCSDVPQTEMNIESLEKYFSECDIDKEETSRTLLSFGASIATLVAEKGSDYTYKGELSDRLKFLHHSPCGRVDCYLIENISDKPVAVVGRVPVLGETTWPIYYAFNNDQCQLVYEPSREKTKNASKQFEMRGNLKPGQKLLMGMVNAKLTLSAYDEVKIYRVSETA